MSTALKLIFSILLLKFLILYVCSHSSLQPLATNKAQSQENLQFFPTGKRSAYRRTLSQL